MGRYSLNTRGNNGESLTINFNVKNTVENPNIAPFVKVDSGTYVTLRAYESRLTSLAMVPSEPTSPFNVITSGMIFTFTRDNQGWKIAYQYACPLFQDDPPDQSFNCYR